MGMKPLRFIRAWQTYSVGSIIRPTAAFAQTLVANKICEYVEEEKKPQAEKITKHTGATLTTRKQRGRKRATR